MYWFIGNLVKRTVLKTGVSSKGQWRIIEFICEKKHKGEKKKFCFVAFGKQADFLNELSSKSRLEINFFPECKEHGGKMFTQLKVLEIKKHTKQRKWFNQLDFFENKGDFSIFKELDNEGKDKL
jgi:hypothetical protein